MESEVPLLRCPPPPHTHTHPRLCAAYCDVNTLSACSPELVKKLPVHVRESFPFFTTHQGGATKSAVHFLSKEITRGLSLTAACAALWEERLRQHLAAQLEYYAKLEQTMQGAVFRKVSMHFS